ncbi:MAG TPA: amidohydrolase family protein [Thermomicrobiales bacterium]|nr:amidohydrolase family protein [Thermomicrobiales bacterium]
MTDHVPVIDSHQHFWNPGTRTYPWLSDPRINRAFGPYDLKPLLDANGVTASVLVQTVSDLDETREFLRIAADHSFVAGVVGWADLTDPQLGATLEELRATDTGSWLVGLRHQVEDEEDDAWLGRDDVQRGLTTIAESGLVYDFLLRPRHLPVALNVARDFPHLRFVIDHMAKPDIAHEAFDDWNAAIHEFAGLENVACKLSGILTEAGDDWTVDDIRPYVRSVVEVFGPHRLMFGSDWPVSLMAAEYATTMRTLRESLDGLGLTDDDIDAIFGRTAIHWYGLESKIPTSNL